MALNLNQWKKHYDLSGKKFGKLTVKKFLYFKFQNKSHGNVSIFLCDCCCGGTKKVARHLLLKGKTKSCGCIKVVKYKTDEKYFERINRTSLRIAIIPKNLLKIVTNCNTS